MSEKNVETHFDQLFNDTTKKYEFDESKMSRKDQIILRYLKEAQLEGKKCADVGPGTGRWIQFLSTLGVNYLAAFDISENSLQKVRPLCQFTQKIDLENENLKLDDGSIDFLLSLEVLEHLKNPGNYLSELSRVLKNEGKALLSLPNLNSFASRIRFLLGKKPIVMVSDPTHVGFYTHADIKKLFNQSGFEVTFYPNSFVLNPFSMKSKLRISSCPCFKTLDDSILFSIRKISKS